MPMAAVAAVSANRFTFLHVAKTFFISRKTCIFDKSQPLGTMLRPKNFVTGKCTNKLSSLEMNCKHYRVTAVGAHSAC